MVTVSYSNSKSGKFSLYCCGLSLREFTDKLRSFLVRLQLPLFSSTFSQVEREREREKRGILVFVSCYKCVDKSHGPKPLNVGLSWRPSNGFLGSHTWISCKTVWIVYWSYSIVVWTWQLSICCSSVVERYHIVWFAWPVEFAAMMTDT